MTHGARFFARFGSFEPIARRFTSRFRCLLCSLLRTAAATLRIGVSRDWVSFAGSGSPVREHRHLFWRLCRNVGRISALPDDADLALGMGLERPGTCRGASGYQYRSGGNLQVQDREAIFPGTFAEFQKDREWLNPGQKAADNG